jgi:hypothetical protein
MKIQFQQKTISGCGSYSLANLYNDDRFLEGVKDLRVGETVVGLNKKMEKYQPNAYITTIFQTSTHFTRQADKLIDPVLFGIEWEKVGRVEKETWARPLLVTYKRTIERFHCVLVIQNLKDNLLYLFDSLQEEVIKYTIDDFITLYNINSVEQFAMWEMEHPEHSMFIIKSAFKHLFEEGQ